MIGIISWVLSSYLTKKSLTKKKINYEIKLFPIISNNFVTRTSDSQIYFHDKLLTEPTLLAVDIINSGNAAIECPPIEIEAVGEINYGEGKLGLIVKDESMSFSVKYRLLEEHHISQISKEAKNYLPIASQ